jgi:glucokinase
MTVPSTALYLGFDLGSTKTAASVWRLDSPAMSPHRLARTEWPTPAGGPRPSLDLMAREGQRLLDEVRARDGGEIAAVGISGGGPVDPQAGRILSIPNLKGWNDVPITRILGDRFSAPVLLENDANACALAEWQYGAGRGSQNLAFLTCSTGIGAGLIVDGRLIRGASSLAGEVGHLEIVPGGLLCGCGRQGCLEAYASGAGIAARLERLRADDPSLPRTAREVVERARRGDEFSRTFLRETAGYLASGLAHLIFCVNPERIILGTIAASAGEDLLEPLRAALRGRVWPALLSGLEVVPSALWPDLGDYAALAVARP